MSYISFTLRKLEREGEDNFILFTMIATHFSTSESDTSFVKIEGRL